MSLAAIQHPSFSSAVKKKLLRLGFPLAHSYWFCTVSFINCPLDSFQH